jgi:GNAT superfamily N-acetyltransferase
VSEPTAQPNGAGSWRPHALAVRPARLEDVAGVAVGVSELLAELGGKPVAATALATAARELIEDESAGALFVADGGGGRIVGLLGASWQLAIHVPGRYALIQELWVEARARGQAIGAALVAALCELARERGAASIEVGLPRESFPALAATRSFYEANSFTAIGQRMRRALV